MTSRDVRLSACIIARDEAASLPACLASVSFCDEVIVVDSGSTDETVAIALAAGASVIEHPWLGYAAQRNIAAEAARGAWVLEVDADERVSTALAAEIRAFVAAPPPGVTLAALPRREVIAGRALGPSTKYPQYCHRLFMRTAHRHDVSRTVHEGLVPDGPVHPFAGELIHLIAGSWTELARDASRYAALEAAQMHAARTPRAILTGVLLRPAAKFAYRMVADGGWRDGPFGAAAILVACGTDAIVWGRHALGLGEQTGRSGAPPGQHYGSRRWPRGAPRAVAVAVGAGPTARARAWASRADAASIDVCIITDCPSAAEGCRTRRLSGVGPLGVLRALEAEEQLRTIDAVVTFGVRARRTVRVAPGGLKGLTAPSADGLGPQELTRRVSVARQELTESP